MGSMFYRGKQRGSSFYAPPCFSWVWDDWAKAQRLFFPGRSRSAGFCHIGSDFGMALRKTRMHILQACFVMCGLIVKCVLQASLAPGNPCARQFGKRGATETCVAPRLPRRHVCVTPIRLASHTVAMLMHAGARRVGSWRTLCSASCSHERQTAGGPQPKCGTLAS